MGSGFSRAGAILIVCFYLVFVFWTSFVVSGTALQDPDTCWLLATGREIVQTRKIPDKDPFSHSLAKSESRFVPYQWLSEVVLFSVYRGYEKLVCRSDYSIDQSGVNSRLTSAFKERLKSHLPEGSEFGLDAGLPDPAAVALLALSALLVVLSFIVIPVFFPPGGKHSPITSLAMVVVGSSAASFHYYLRPEIFSYFYLAVFLAIVNHIRLVSTYEGRGIRDFRLHLGGLLLLSILWANSHSGFVCGIIFLVVLVLMESIKGNTVSLRLSASALAVFLAGTFVTPFGIGLYQYLPHLFFADSNSLIEELGPLAPADYLTASYFPFLILIFLVAGLCGHCLLRGGIALIRPVLHSLVIVILAIPVGMFCRRLIPFSSLVMIFEVIYLFAYLKAYILEPSKPVFVKEMSAKLYRFFKYRWWSTSVSLVIVLFSAFLQCRIFIPGIPQVSTGFAPPLTAVAYIQENKPRGRLFNDPQFGDILLWHLYPCPPLFVDTRFDVYGSKIVIDSWKIESGLDGWEKLLEQYKSDWIFVPTQSMLAHKLEQAEDWKQIYKDGLAVIYERRAAEAVE